MKDYPNEWSNVLLTDSDNNAVFLVQFIKVEILFSTQSEICKMEFGELTKERSRIFGQGVPGRGSVDKDGGDECRPEKTEYLHCRQDSTTSMRKIEERQVCWDSQEQNEEPERPTCLCLFEDEMHKLQRKVMMVIRMIRNDGSMQAADSRVQLQLQSTKFAKVTAKW